MTATPAAIPTAVAGAYETPKKDRTQVFTLDGHPLTVYRVKAAWYIKQAETRADLPEDDPRQIELLHEAIEKVFGDPADREYLYARLEDDEDDFDYDDLGLVIRAIRGGAGGRPTGPSIGPSDRRSKTGGRSTARRR